MRGLMLALMLCADACSAYVGSAFVPYPAFLPSLLGGRFPCLRSERDSRVPTRWMQVVSEEGDELPLSWEVLERSISLNQKMQPFHREVAIGRLYMLSLPLQLPPPLEPLAILAASLPIIGAIVKHSMLVIELKGGDQRWLCADFEPIGKTNPEVTLSLLLGQAVPGAVRMRYLRGKPRGSKLAGEAAERVTLGTVVDFGARWDPSLILIRRDCSVFTKHLTKHLLSSPPGGTGSVP